MRLRIFAGLILCAAAMAQAAPQIRVVGLFANAALLNVDGQRVMLKVGRVGPHGLELLAADSATALILVDGREQSFALERDYAPGGYAEPQKQSVRLVRERDGHYHASGQINGRSLSFMLDTGATTIAISQAQADALGLDYKRGTRVRISTASGEGWAWSIQLDSVSVSGIRQTMVPALVVPGSYPSQALLGMSFLNRLHWREEQGVLVLEAKY